MCGWSRQISVPMVKGEQMNKYGDFRAYCDEIDSCDLCNSRVRFWCKVKCRIEEWRVKIIKALRRKSNG